MKIDKEQIGIVDFESRHKGLSNSVLLEKIYIESEIASKLKKSDHFYVYELVDLVDRKPLFTFVYNKGFMRGKVFCILLTHSYKDDKWNTDISEPFIKEGDKWVSGKFRTKARDEEITKIIKSGEIWK
ncbi:MAG: hypothetical protein J6R59_00530 [Paludibacteraceae bacterium]|nr:hypothetical protein [Paludibacteraceae bacterium]